MTKPVTTIAMMLLYEQGLWSPNDPIARNLPEFAGVKGPDGAAPDHPPDDGEADVSSHVQRAQFRRVPARRQGTPFIVVLARRPAARHAFNRAW
jgi:Beta-lactamase